MVLPGSANGIGGQAFTIKLRKTAERSTTAMLVEPPYDINRTRSGDGFTPWRQMKWAGLCSVIWVCAHRILLLGMLVERIQVSQEACCHSVHSLTRTAGRVYGMETYSFNAPFH